jgi:hypothetical protein
MHAQAIEAADAPARREYSEEEIRTAIACGLVVWEVMDVSGDLKQIWDPRKAGEVEEQRRIFERLTKEKKYRAYNVTDDNKPGEPMETFDASAGRVIFRPQFVGG